MRSPLEIIFDAEDLQDVDHLMIILLTPHRDGIPDPFFPLRHSWLHHSLENWQITPFIVGTEKDEDLELFMVWPMGDLAADHPVWWRWAYLGLWQSSSQLQLISATLARWSWAYLGSAMLKPAKSLIGAEIIGVPVSITPRASHSGTYLQTLPELATALKGHSLSPRSCPPMLSPPSERFEY